ncbi:MAG: hypothetical protein ACTHM6_14070 [Tepidisphaeraceae bacterium]
MKRTTWIGVIGLAMLAGCSPQQYGTRGPVNTEPMTVDQAMQQRDWDVTHAYYANGSTRNWSTGFRYEPTPGMDEANYYYADLGTFLVNVVTLPFTYIDQSDGVISNGVVVPPSYTAVPPLPPSDAPTPMSTTQPTGTH